MVWKKGKKRKEKRAQSLQAIGMKILLPVFLALFGLLICLFIGLGETRNVANQYVQDTAELYVEQVNKDILQMNTELIQILVSNDYIAKIPAEIKAEDAQYYYLLRDIREENRMLKIRYEEVTNFFVYAQEADLLIGDSGVVFAESQVSGLMDELREFSRKSVRRTNSTTIWNFLEAEGDTYIIGWYAKKQKMMGCVIKLNDIFSMIQSMTENYKVIPFMRQQNGTIIFPENCEEPEDIEQERTYEYQLGTLGKIGIYILPDGGILENVLRMQVLLLLLIIVLLSICSVQLFYYFRNLMRPLQSFVQGITELEEEQQLNENGENNILELEAVSDRFRGMLRKIQSLKIAIYEKELNEQKAELEYMQEQILRDLYVADSGWTIALLRYFNPVGAHESGLIGEDPKGIPNNLTPYIAKVAIGELKEIGVFGNDYPTPDGTGVRDYIHVVDLAKGHVAAIHALSKPGVYTYNLGTGIGYSVLDVIHAFERACGKKLPYVIKPRRAGDIAACYANADKAKAELHWQAQLGLDDMCASLWKWQTQNPNGYRS